MVKSRGTSHLPDVTGQMRWLWGNYLEKFLEEMEWAWEEARERERLLHSGTPRCWVR